MYNCIYCLSKSLVYGIYRDYQKSRTYTLRGNNSECSHVRRKPANKRYPVPSQICKNITNSLEEVRKLQNVKSGEILWRRFLKSWRACIWVILPQAFTNLLTLIRADEDISSYMGFVFALNPLYGVYLWFRRLLCSLKRWSLLPGTCRARLPLRRRCRR